MIRLLVMLLIFAITLVSALAQEKSEKPAEGTVQKSDITSQPKTSQTFQMTIIPDRQPVSLKSGQAIRPSLVGEPTFLIRDGGIQLSIFQDSLLIPMPGGGASGCLSLQSPEQLEKLIQALQLLQIKKR